MKTRISFFLLLVFFAINVMAQDNSADLKKQQSDIQNEINQLRKQLELTQKDKKASLSQLTLVQRKLKLREAAIRNINQQINTIEKNIIQSRKEINSLRSDLDTLRLQYEKSVVYAYKNRSNYDFLNFIFSASNFNDALKRVQYLKSYRTYREQQAVNIRSTQVLLEKKIATLENSRSQKDLVLLKQQEEKEQLVEAKKDKNAVLSKIKSRESEISKELTAKRKADTKLRNAIQVAIKREIKLAEEARKKREAAEAAALAEKLKREAAANPNAATKPAEAKVEEKTAVTKPAPEKSKSVFDDTPAGKVISDNFEKNKGSLPWPVAQGRIKIPFGFYAIEETKLQGNNPGLTIEMEKGAAVRSVYDGEVVTVFDMDGNSAVMVSHGKYFTVYSNLSSVSVTKGQKISTSQTIGRAGANDYGNGEIEFVLLLESKNLDPEQWLKK